MNTVKITNFDFLYDEINNYNIQPYDIENLQAYFKKRKGWIYISKNASEAAFKIGRTTKSPWERAKTLSPAGVLHDFEVLFALPVYQNVIVEQLVHRILKKYRVKSSKEFFLCNLEIAAKAVEQAQQEEKNILSKTFNDSFFEEDISLMDTSWIRGLNDDSYVNF